VPLQTAAGELLPEELIELEDSSGVGKVDTHQHGAVGAVLDVHRLDGGGGNRVNAHRAGRKGNSGAAFGHVQRVRHAHNAGFEGERPPAGAVGDDRVQHFAAD